MAECKRCNKTKTICCTKCKGAGTVQGGVFKLSEKCVTCSGTGQVKCPTCRGTGYC